MAEKEIILELDYRISPEDFYTFSVRSMNRQYAARAKKTNFTGILKLLVGILVLGYVIYARQTAMIQSPLMNEVVLVLAVVIFLILLLRDRNKKKQKADSDGGTGREENADGEDDEW